MENESERFGIVAKLTFTLFELQLRQVFTGGRPVSKTTGSLQAWLSGFRSRWLPGRRVRRSAAGTAGAGGSITKRGV